MTISQLIDAEKDFGDIGFFQYVFVDDGSEDDTWSKLIGEKNNRAIDVTLVRLEKNVGSYNAIVAALPYANGNCVVVMAADLQDPPEMIKSLYGQWFAGAKLVVASRSKQSSLASGIFNRMMTILLPSLPKAGFDFCLFDESLKDKLLRVAVPDMNCLYLLVTLTSSIVQIPYTKGARQIGKSMWTTRKKITLAWKTLAYFSKRRMPLPAAYRMIEVNRRRAVTIVEVQSTTRA